MSTVPSVAFRPPINSPTWCVRSAQRPSGEHPAQEVVDQGRMIGAGIDEELDHGRVVGPDLIRCRGLDPALRFRRVDSTLRPSQAVALTARYKVAEEARAIPSC